MRSDTALTVAARASLVALGCLAHMLAVRQVPAGKGLPPGTGAGVVVERSPDIWSAGRGVPHAHSGDLHCADCLNLAVCDGHVGRDAVARVVGWVCVEEPTAGSTRGWCGWRE